MAPGVAKTFIKELYKIMCIKYPECSEEKLNGEMGNEDIKAHLKQYQKENRLLLDNLDYVRELIKKNYSKALDDNEITALFNTTLKYTEDATHQAMEAVVHNLNSMHSRAGAQVDLSVLA